jgi:hypothetical protein
LFPTKQRVYQSISTTAGLKHQTPNFSLTRGAIPLAEKHCTQIIRCLMSAPKCRLHPLGTNSSPVFLAKGASDATRWSFFKRNASRTLPLAPSYKRVVRSTNFTLESSEVFLWRERRAPVGPLAARAARCRPNLLARSGQHTRLGLLSRPVRAQSSRRHEVEHLHVQAASERHGKQRRT